MILLLKKNVQEYQNINIKQFEPSHDYKIENQRWRL